jgi:hypothetical protein
MREAMPPFPQASPWRGLIKRIWPRYLYRVAHASVLMRRHTDSSLNCPLTCCIPLCYSCLQSKCNSVSLLTRNQARWLAEWSNLSKIEFIIHMARE